MNLPSFYELLEQHDNYALNDHLSLGRRKGQKWLIYWDGVEIHFKADPKATPREFATAREAFVYLQTEKGWAAVAAAAPNGGVK